MDAKLKKAIKNDPTTNRWLIECADEGNLEGVDEALNGGAIVASYNNKAIELAAESGSFAVVRRLLENGAKVDAQDAKAPIKAAWKGHHEVVELFLDHGVKITRQMITKAVSRTDSAVFDVMLKHPSTSSNNTEMMVVIAAQARKTHWIPTNVIWQINYDQRMVLLRWAARSGDKQSVETCLKVTKANQSHINRALAWAAEEQQEAIMDVLLESGADLDDAIKQAQTRPTRELLATRAPKLAIFRDSAQAAPESLFF